MNISREREKARAIIRGLVHKWDPYALIAHGAPANEWDDEVEQIVERIHRFESPMDGARVLSEVFSSSLGPAGFEPERCREWAEELHQALAATGLIRHE